MKSKNSQTYIGISKKSEMKINNTLRQNYFQGFLCNIESY